MDVEKYVEFAELERNFHHLDIDGVASDWYVNCKILLVIYLIIFACIEWMIEGKGKGINILRSLMQNWIENLGINIYIK